MKKVIKNQNKKKNIHKKLHGQIQLLFSALLTQKVVIINPVRVGKNLLN